MNSIFLSDESKRYASDVLIPNLIFSLSPTGKLSYPFWLCNAFLGEGHEKEVHLLNCSFAISITFARLQLEGLLWKKKFERFEHCLSIVDRLMSSFSLNAESVTSFGKWHPWITFLCNDNGNLWALWCICFLLACLGLLIFIGHWAYKISWIKIQLYLEKVKL